MSNQARRTCISISPRTKDILVSVKHTGQSYDGLLQELVEFWNQKKGVGTGPAEKNIRNGGQC